MALRFIVGSAGSGKSVYLYKTLIEASMKNPKKKYMMIVPEQFTLQTQKELVSLHPGHSVMNIEVLSFDRLAYRVFDEMGTEILSVLEDTGKNLVLRKIAEDKKEELSILRGNMSKPGYISEMKSLISELKQYDISPDTFAEISNEVSYPAFQAKAKDILVMYRGFQEFIKDRYITTEEILELLISVVEDSILVKDSVMIFDGFTGFTPIQLKLLRILMPMVETMVCTVTMDGREHFQEEVKEEDLFYMSKRMMQQLVTIAAEVHVDVEDPLIMDMTGPCRFTKDGELAHLERNLFRKQYQKFHKTGEQASELEIYRVANPRMELAFVAARIQRMIRQGGYHYRDFAIVCANMSDYENYIQEIFQKYEMPIFVDASAEMKFQPCMEFLRSALLMVEDNFSYASVFHFLRSGLCDLSMDEIDALDNYVRAAGIRGKNGYFRVFKMIPREYTPEQVADLNEIRQKFADAVRPFFETMHGDHLTVRERTEALYHLLMSYNVEEKLQNYAQSFYDMQDGVRGKQYEQIYGIVMDLFDKMVTILGEESMTLDAYHKMLDAGLDAVKIGVIPPTYDSILFGDIERTRLEHIKVLFFIGVNDGAVPRAVSTTGILSQLDRYHLKELDITLAPTDREKMFIQKFYLYLILTKASEKLVITYGRTSNSGDAVRKSYLVQTLCHMFPDLQIQDLEDLPREDRMASPAPAVEYLAEEMRSGVASQDSIPESILKLYGWLKKEDAELANFLLQSACFYQQQDPIQEAAVRAMGDSVHGSVTRLETYAKCAYSYFLQYGLGLKERQEHELKVMDLGDLYHDALERYAKKLEVSQYSWYQVPKEQRKVFLEESIQEAYQNMVKTEFLQEAKERYVLKQMEQTLERTVEVLTTQVRKGRFIPKGFEVDFRQFSSLDSLQFALEDGTMMKLHGKIDRLDTFETDDKVYVKIIDYKSGSKKFDFQEMYYGLQMQLILYMSAAMENEKQNTEKQVVPAGMLYYLIDDPIVDMQYNADLSGEEQAEKHEKEVLLFLRGDGLVNEADEVIDALEDTRTKGKSVAVPIEFKQDLTLASSSKTMTESQFAHMEQHVKRKIMEAGNGIAKGAFPIAPYQLEKHGGCDFCDYKDVCGFDQSLPGFAYHKLKKLSKDEVWEMIAEEEKDE